MNSQHFRRKKVFKGVRQNSVKEKPKSIFRKIKDWIAIFLGLMRI